MSVYNNNLLINNSLNIFPFDSREFPQYLQRKELKWIEISLAEEIFRGIIFSQIMNVYTYRCSSEDDADNAFNYYFFLEATT